MKREYISPIAGYNSEMMTSKDLDRPQLGGGSRGAASMHGNDSFFEEDTNEEDWVRVGNLWDE